MATQEQNVDDLLKTHASIVKIDGGKKLKCILSGHEMPTTTLAIQTYVNGKKYKKLMDECAYDYHQFKQFLQPAKKKNKRGMLLCALTLRHISNHWVHIDRHIKGKRFLREYKRWHECEEKGEKFVPLAKRHRKKDIDEVETDNMDAKDDLSDLYPFATEQGDSEDDECDEDDMVEEVDTLAAMKKDTKKPPKQDGTKAQKRKPHIESEMIPTKKLKMKEAKSMQKPNSSKFQKGLQRSLNKR